MATTKTKKVTKKRDYLTLHALAYILTWQTLYRTLNVVDLHIFFIIVVWFFLVRNYN